MTLQVSVVQGDVSSVPSDLLILKYARSFYGADEAVATRLLQQGVCQERDISPHEGEAALVDSQGAVAARRVLFIGTAPLLGFRYREMRQFARRAIEVAAADSADVRTISLTVHGAGYGLDIEEAFKSLVTGLQQGLVTSPLPHLEEVLFVERNARRLEVLRELVEDVELVSPPRGAPVGGVVAGPPPEPKRRMVFVAMPFSEEFEDVYQFGIYNTVRRCGYICEKVDESAYAGSIVDRIMEGIRNADFVIADLTLERPNVYLEVGYAWGLQRPVILLAREGQRLHFDLSHHKCLFYKTIGKLADSLEKTIIELFGLGQGREGGGGDSARDGT